MNKLPKYLQKYIVRQNYNQYTYLDHACWRFIMRINKEYFSKNAHSKYLEGISDTGITIDRIPKISDISKKLKEFGWSAVGVRGFLPPLIFMDFQSKGILPIACDMRSIQHLTYTPAPDIVHEASGHAPMIVDSDYADYLKYYGQIASKAISSLEDYNLYVSIRKLSDIKENPISTNKDIKIAQYNLKNAIDSVSYISEAAYLSRINWWTVEYGLVGNINKPKIYGAGLLSSIEESKNCLKDSVKKIPLSIDCINYSYDITEQQPQLFVADDFKSLNEILDDFSSKMAYKIGGLEGVKKAIKSKTVCTLSINSGIQISGKINDIINNQLSYVQLAGPVQICYDNKEIEGQGVYRHPEGFGFPLGELENNIQLDTLNKDQLLELGYNINSFIDLKYKSGICIKGILKSVLEKDSYIKIITFSNCMVKYHDRVIFNPDWGEYDLICGQSIDSVFGGPADIDLYFNSELNKNKIDSLNKNISVSSIDEKLNEIYYSIRSFRDRKSDDFSKLNEISNILSDKYPDDWLSKLEIYEIIYDVNLPWKRKIKEYLESKTKSKDQIAKAIKSSINLLEK